MAKTADTHRKTLGLLITFENSRSFEVWRGASDAARAHDINLFCFPAGLVSTKETFLQNPRRVLCDLIGESSLDGLLTFQWWTSQAWLEESIGHFQLPILNILRRYPGYQSVTADDEHGMQALMRHLIEDHGYRRIAYLGTSEEVSSEKIRYRAYVESLKNYDLDYEPQLVGTRSHTGLFNEARGRRGVEQLLEERRLKPGKDIEAMVCFNDQMAFGALEALQARGIRVPEDLAVTGFDNIVRTEVSTPPLTSVAFPWYEMGRQAVKTLLEHLSGVENNLHVQVPASPVLRRSCGCLESAVTQAAKGIPIGHRESHAATEASRHAVLTEEVMSILAHHVDEPSAYAQDLIEAIESGAAETRAFSSFLAVLRSCLYQLADQHDNIQEVGQKLISVLRSRLGAAHAQDSKAQRQLEQLWQQCRTLVGEILQWSQGRIQLEQEQQSASLRELGQRLISTFETEGLVRALAEGLPELGIPGAWLAVYEDPQLPTAQSRLLLAYTAEQGRLAVRSENALFPSSEFVPEGFLDRKRAHNLVAEALYFGNEQLGFIVFEQGPRDARIYEILRAEISSALQGALLFERVQQHAAEIARQKYVLDTFMDTVPDWIYFKDRAGRITQANKAFIKRFGLDGPEAVLGKTDVDFFPEELARMKEEQEQDILTTGNALLGLEELDQHNVWALTTKMPLRNEHGDIIGTFGFSRDINKLKQAEQELRRYRDHLEELVRARTTELRRANEALHAQITERQRAEEALHVSEQQYRLLAENVKDGIIILQEKRVVFVNTAFAAMIQHDIDRLYAGDPAKLFPRSMTFLDQSRAPASSRTPCQEEFITESGERTWVEIEQSAMLWNNQPANLLTVRNITHAKLREIRLEEERSRLHQENLTFKSTIAERFRFGSLVGKSPAMQRVYELIISAAAAEANVLVQGESGTGKELVADTIHQVSARKNRALVAVNCASIPETLFEREFFGHRKGAFTGADRDKSGFFDRASQGLLFLDEVTEMPPGAQAKLLRVLQSGDYLPLGGTSPKQANVMIVAAGNRDFRKEIEAGRLRQDFFYRIGVVRIDIPPLRERKEDLPLLLDHFLTQYREKQQAQSARPPQHLVQEPGELPAELLNAFHAYEWPGNVRELQNVLQHYLVTGDLASTLALIGVSRSTQPEPGQLELPPEETSLHAAVEQVERRMIAAMLIKTGNNRRKTARLLGISRRTLYLKLEKFGLLE